jgi:hypothetical protein
MQHNSSGRKTSFARGDIGASMIASLDEGVQSYKSANEVLQFAIDEIQGKKIKDIDNQKMFAGRYLENAIIDMYCNVTKTDNEKINVDPPVIQHEITPLIPEKVRGYLAEHGLDKVYVSASRDAYLIDNSEIPIEVKNLSGSADQPIKTNHWVQLQTQMLCSNGPHYGVLLRLINGWDLKIDEIPIDNDYQDKIVFMAVDFWTRVGCIINRPERLTEFLYPCVSSAEASRFIVSNDNKDTIDLQAREELKDLILQHIEQKKIQNESKTQVDSLEVKIKEILGEHQVGLYQIGDEKYEIKHTKFERKKTKTVPVEGEPPTIGRRFQIKYKGAK